MSCGCTNEIQQFSLNPVKAQWAITKGDSSSLETYFYELDETTLFNTTGWTYLATVYDKYNDSLEELEVVSSNGYVKVIASATSTANWGPQVRFSTAELRFDVKAYVPQVGDDLVWTFINGTICLSSDVMSGSSL
jgi:hypothetical protein